MTVGEIGAPPAGRRLNGIECSHLGALREVFAVGVQGFQFGQSKHVIVFTLGQDRGGHAHKTHLGVHLKTHRGNIWIRKISLGLVDERDGLFELRGRRAFHLEAHGESKSATDAGVFIVARAQDKTAQIAGRAEINLHPFGGAWILHDGAVVAIFGALALQLCLGGEGRNLLIQRLHRRAPGLFHFGIHGGELLVQLCNMGGKVGFLFIQLRGRVVRAVGTIHSSKDGLQAVIMLLRVRIEFVIVAARTLDGGTGESVERVAHHFIAINVARDAAVDLGFRNFNVPDEIPRAGGNEAKPKDAVGRAGKERIAGNLFLHKPGVRFVFVERTNNVIAIRPGVGPELVLVIPAGVGVLHHIEPVSAPAFAVARAGEQSIGQCGDGLIAIGFRRRFKRRDLRGRGRQAGEVKGHAPDQRAVIGFRRGRHADLRLFGADK